MTCSILCQFLFPSRSLGTLSPTSLGAALGHSSYLPCQHSHLAGPEDKLVLEVMVHCSESQWGVMWIFWCEVFSHFLDSLEPQCHVVVTAELLYPSQLFWPKTLVQMYLYQSICAHPALEKTSINLTSSFTFVFLRNAVSTAYQHSCPGLIALIWNPCNCHSSVSWTKDLSTSMADTVAKLCGYFDTSLVLL